MEIAIKNCNNINNALINIQEGRLNIKYAINGTGKSSISKAIDFSKSEEQLKSLKPYKYLSDDFNTQEYNPKVDISSELTKISIFNEETLEQYTFLPNDLLANSFEILIKTEDYERRMQTIQGLIQDIQNTFRENPDFDQLISELTTFISGFGTTQNGYSKTGSIGKGLAKGNKIVHVPTELAEYTPFIQSQNNATWLTWQSKGIQFMETIDKCPYCAEGLIEEKKQKLKKWLMNMILNMLQSFRR